MIGRIVSAEERKIIDGNRECIKCLKFNMQMYGLSKNKTNTKIDRYKSKTLLKKSKKK